ncbi:hypothetical protein [Streptomyces sp. NPDC060001]|uniref:hypothetical protein n=1 Tax=Streptomyces sp. NPDC060001 TaxID=3347032 RepID=UPI0036AC3B88
MAVIRALPRYARLRRLPDDPRLYITENGSTRAGQLTHVGLRFRNDDFPYLTLELDTTGPFEPDSKPERFELRAPDLFAADIDALAPHGEHDHAYQELQRCCESLRDALNSADPQCRHEDVIEIPEVGKTAVPGICMWCPVPLVLVDDEWAPATVHSVMVIKRSSSSDGA